MNDEPRPCDLIPALWVGIAGVQHLAHAVNGAVGLVYVTVPCRPDQVYTSASNVRSDTLAGLTAAKLRKCKACTTHYFATLAFSIGRKRDKT